MLPEFGEHGIGGERYQGKGVWRRRKNESRLCDTIIGLTTFFEEKAAKSERGGRVSATIEGKTHKGGSALHEKNVRSRTP